MKNAKIEQSLRQIAAQNGGILRPEDVVQSAKNPKSPLHSRFQWDNTKAAHEYRLFQARHLISVTVEVIGNEPESPVFVSLSTDRGQGARGYRVLSEVMSDTELQAQLLRDALAELNRLQQKFRNLKALAQVFEAIRKVKSKKAA